MTSGVPAIPLTTISGGINRLRLKGGADKNSLYDLLNGYVTQANTIKVRPGTTRHTNLAPTTGVAGTAGLVGYQGDLHVFSSSIVDVPDGYVLHVLNYPAFTADGGTVTITPAQFSSPTYIGGDTNYGEVSNLYGFASEAIISGGSADVGSVSPTEITGTNFNGFFATTSGSPDDPNEVYLVVSGTALPSSGVTVSYPNSGGTTTSVSLPTPTTNLNLPEGYVAYALGTTQPAIDPYFSDVSVLLNGGTDESQNGLAVTIGSGVALSSSSPPPGYAEFLQFSNPGSPGVTFDIGSPLQTAQSALTVEFWIKPGSQVGSEGSVINNVYGGTGGTWNIDWSNSSGGTLAGVVAGVSIPSAPGAVPSGSWSWVQIVFTAGNPGTATIYVNGVSEATGTGSSATEAYGGVMTLGYHAGAQSFTGGLGALRVTNNVARSASDPSASLPSSLVLSFTNSNAGSYPIKEIHFAAPFLGGLYVVAEFDVPSALAAEYGTVFHYWVQSSTASDNSNVWEANTDYQIGSVVIPTVQNGLTYIASRRYPASPLWTADTQETVGNVIEPTISNGFNYTVISTEGATPTTGATEPTWPTSDGATVSENSTLTVDQTVTLVTGTATYTGSVPTRYTNIAGGFIK